MKYIRRLSVAAATFAAAGLLSAYTQSPSAPARPAPRAEKHMLFRVQGKSGATVYLLGSVHLLDAKAGVLPAVVDSAFAHAKTVAFEASLDTIQMRGMEMMARGQYTNGATLSSSLSAANRPKVDSILKQYGLSIQQVDRFKPWLVSVLLTQMAMQKAQFQAQYGVDMQINTRAKQAGKSVIGLETVDFQLGLFDRVPAADQERMITMTNSPDSSAHMLSRIKDAWLSGDATLIDSLLNQSSVEAPGFYAMMVTDRNKSWIPKIEQLLGGKDDALVVVGAAHLVGKDGVVAMLKAKGYTIEQM
jgi:uncharacterized protein YbaP (TraB family)